MTDKYKELLDFTSNIINNAYPHLPSFVNEVEFYIEQYNIMIDCMLDLKSTIDESIDEDERELALKSMKSIDFSNINCPF